MRAITIGLYNTYDKHKYTDQHERSIHRAAGYCHALGFNLAIINYDSLDPSFNLKLRNTNDKPTPLIVLRHDERDYTTFYNTTIKLKKILF